MLEDQLAEVRQQLHHEKMAREPGDLSELKSLTNEIELASTAANNGSVFEVPLSKGPFDLVLDKLNNEKADEFFSLVAKCPEIQIT